MGIEKGKFWLLGNNVYTGEGFHIALVAASFPTTEQAERYIRSMNEAHAKAIEESKAVLVSVPSRVQPHRSNCNHWAGGSCTCGSGRP